jgi:AcrR family transcriptional regulator
VSQKRTSRQERAQDRSDAIVAAALAEFTAHGFAAATVDNIARRAGVAKGTVFHHFADKQQLFEGMARAFLKPSIDHIERFAPPPGIPVRMAVEAFVLPLIREVAGPRGDVVRLFISEGLRFPSLAEFYHREILSRVFAIQRRLLAAAAERGELADPAIAQFPQLVGAPLVVGLLWHGLFQRIEPLDLEALVKTQLDCLFVSSARRG